MSGIILTKPQVSGFPGTIHTGIIIPHAAPSNVVIVDSISCDYNVSVKWIYTIYSASKDKMVSAEILALHRLGTNPTHNRYGIIGDRGLLPHTIDVFADGTSLGLRITNMSENIIIPSNWIDYHVNVVRIQLLG